MASVATNEKLHVIVESGRVVRILSDRKSSLKVTVVDKDIQGEEATVLFREGGVRAYPARLENFVPEMVEEGVVNTCKKTAAKVPERLRPSTVVSKSRLGVCR